jgi:hypothetical protein
LSEALEDADTALLHFPYDAGLMEQRADVAHALRMWDVALADYDAAIAARPGSKDLGVKRRAVYAASLAHARDRIA